MSHPCSTQIASNLKTLRLQVWLSALICHSRFFIQTELRRMVNFHARVPSTHCQAITSCANLLMLMTSDFVLFSMVWYLVFNGILKKMQVPTNRTLHTLVLKVKVQEKAKTYTSTFLFKKPCKKSRRLRQLTVTPFSHRTKKIIFACSYA